MEPGSPDTLLLFSHGMVRLQTLGALALRHDSGREITGISPKRLGVLLYLVLATPRALHRRDRVAALFWPESDSAKARAALSRALYELRNALGQEVFVTRGDEEVGVDFTRLDCDVVRFEDLFQTRDYHAALDLFKGELLPGFFVADAAVELDEWLERRRMQLQAMAGDAAWRLAEEAEQQNRYADAVRYAQRSLGFHPGNETWLRRVMQLLDRAGDRASAAGVYREFAANLESAFELEPSPETQQLLAQIHKRAGAVPLAAEKVTAVSAQPPARRKPPYKWAIALTVLLLSGALTARLVTSRAAQHHVLAVGVIETSHDSLAGFNTLLTTNLARLEDVDLLSEGRVIELAQKVGNDMSKSARSAGATALFEGALTESGGGLRLDLRQIDLRTGRIARAFSINARDVYELADIAVERIARELGLAAPADRLDAHTTSLVAYRMYEEGLRAYHAMDDRGAEKYFRLALREDSTFAMAAWYLSTLDDYDRMRAVAYRLAAKSHERERLFIHAQVAHALNQPNALAIAETLATRYPHEPDALLAYAKALGQVGRQRAAIPYVQRVLATDTPGMNNMARCRACAAFGLLDEIYSSLEALPELVELGRLRRELQPKNYSAWVQYWSALTRVGNYEGALAAMDSAGPLASDRFAHLGYYTDIWMRRGEFDRIDRHWQEMLRAPDVERQEEALWFLMKSYREQGRFNDAMAAARAFRMQRNDRIHEKNVQPLYDPTWGDRLNEAIILLEIGRAREAGALFEKIATQDRRPINSQQARSRAWHFNHAATAYAQAGDTAKLRVLYDSVRLNADRTSNNTMRGLHHYVRGLRLSLAGKDREALAAFLAAPPMRRVQYQRARTYLALNMPDSARAELKRALAGPHHHFGLYLTQSDIQELLGTTYERLNQPDSARALYEQLVRAWRRADPILYPRRAQVRARLHQLGGSQ